MLTCSWSCGGFRPPQVWLLHSFQCSVRCLRCVYLCVTSLLDGVWCSSVCAPGGGALLCRRPAGTTGRLQSGCCREPCEPRHTADLWPLMMSSGVAHVTEVFYVLFSKDDPVNLLLQFLWCIWMTAGFTSSFNESLTSLICKELHTLFVLKTSSVSLTSLCVLQPGLVQSVWGEWIINILFTSASFISMTKRCAGICCCGFNKAAFCFHQQHDDVTADESLRGRRETDDVTEDLQLLFMFNVKICSCCAFNGV